MADAINLTVGLSSTIGSATINSGTLTKSIGTIVGTHMGGGITQAIGTSNEAVGIPVDVTGDCFFVAKNLDSTNYVEIFKDNANSHLKARLNAGEIALIPRTAASEFYARANTAAVNIQFWVTQV